MFKVAFSSSVKLEESIKTIFAAASIGFPFSDKAAASCKRTEFCCLIASALYLLFSSSNFSALFRNSVSSSGVMLPFAVAAETLNVNHQLFYPFARKEQA